MDDDHRLRSLVTVAGPAIVAAAAAVIGWLRLTPITRGTMWAEDGHRFLADALTDGVPGLFKSYDGYLQLVPRIEALVVAHGVTVGHYAVAMAAASCVVAGVSAAVVYLCTAEVASGWQRVALALVTVLTPALPIEVLGNAANVHTLLMWSALWALIHQPRHRWSGIALGCWVLAVALSEIQTVLLLPLLAWRWRDPQRLPVRVGLVLGLAAEAIATLLDPRAPAVGSAPGWGRVAEGFLANVCYPIWVVPRRLLQATQPWSWAIAAVTVVAVCLAAVVAFRHGRGATRVAAISLPLLAVASWSLDTRLNHAVTTFPSPDNGTYVLLRYAALPAMCLCGEIILATVVTWRRPAQRSASHHWAALAVTAGLLATAVVGFRPGETFRLHGPSWSDAVRAQHADCAHLPPATEITIPEAPNSTWTLTLTCAQLQ